MFTIFYENYVDNINICIKYRFVSHVKGIVCNCNKIISWVKNKEFYDITMYTGSILTFGY